MPDYFYVYPAYLAEGTSRRGGRRIPAPSALKEVSAEEIVQAAKRLGLSAVAEPAKQYPRQVSAYAGRVKITKKGSTAKAELLRRLAVEIRKLRPRGGAAGSGGA